MTAASIPSSKPKHTATTKWTWVNVSFSNTGVMKSIRGRGRPPLARSPTPLQKSSSPPPIPPPPPSKQKEWVKKQCLESTSSSSSSSSSTNFIRSTTLIDPTRTFSPSTTTTTNVEQFHYSVPPPDSRFSQPITVTKSLPESTTIRSGTVLVPDRPASSPPLLMGRSHHYHHYHQQQEQVNAIISSSPPHSSPTLIQANVSTTNSPMPIFGTGRKLPPISTLFRLIE